MRRNRITSRVLALVLAFAMAVTMVPAQNLQAAEPAGEQPAISTQNEEPTEGKEASFGWAPPSRRAGRGPGRRTPSRTTPRASAPRRRKQRTGCLQRSRRSPLPLRCRRGWRCRKAGTPIPTGRDWGQSL